MMISQAEGWACGPWVCRVRHNFFVFSPVLREGHVTAPAHSPPSVYAGKG